MENKGTENRNRATVTVSKDEVIAKLKDDGDFDRLRLKIIRKLKDDEELRNNIISAVKQSAALNRAGAENMKPRQLSDAIYEEVGSKVMSQMSDGVWKIIRSEDGMKSEIMETVQTVYDKLVNPGGTRVGDSSTSGMMAVTKEAGGHSPITFSSGKVDDTVSDYEPKEPPGFSLPRNHDDNNHEKQPQDRLQVPYNKEPVEESKEEPLHPCPPGFSKEVEHRQPVDGSDEDPDFPPGFA